MRFFRSNSPGWAYSAIKCQIFSSYCALCFRPGQPGIDLCAPCQRAFRSIMHTGSDGITTRVCLSCGVPQILSVHPQASPCDPPEYVNHDGESADLDTLNSLVTANRIDEYCPDCTPERGLFFQHLVAPYQYAFPIDAMLKRLKYRQDRQLARMFGALLARHVARQHRSELPQILLPMPLHATRLRERGFNQAQDIAHWCGKELRISVQPGRVSRIAETGSLAGLSRVARQHRILGAFRADDALAGQRVAIVDDVLTTGASSRELAREIYDSGAESVELWVLARTSSTRVGG